MASIGDNIKHYRKLRHMTQKQLGEKVGCATITIQQYEAGKYNPKIENLKKIADALRISASQFYLLTGKFIDSPTRKIEQIADHYGFRLQSQMMIEECSELTKAICKWNRKHGDSIKSESSDCPERTAIIEELADVMIVAKELTYLLYAEDEVEKQIEFKLNRQLARMEGENAD